MNIFVILMLFLLGSPLSAAARPETPIDTKVNLWIRTFPSATPQQKKILIKSLLEEARNQEDSRVFYRDIVGTTLVDRPRLLESGERLTTPDYIKYLQAKAKELAEGASLDFEKIASHYETPLEKAFRHDYNIFELYTGPTNEAPEVIKARRQERLKAASLATRAHLFDPADTDSGGENLWETATEKQRRAIINHLQTLLDEAKDSEWVTRDLTDLLTLCREDFLEKHPGKTLAEGEAAPASFILDIYEKKRKEAESPFLICKEEYEKATAADKQLMRHELHEQRQRNKARYYRRGGWCEPCIPLPSGKRGGPRDYDREIDELGKLIGGDTWEELPAETPLQAAERELFFNGLQQERLIRQGMLKEAGMFMAFEKGLRMEIDKLKKAASEPHEEPKPKTPDSTPAVKPFPYVTAAGSGACALAYVGLLSKEYQTYCAQEHDENPDAPLKTFMQFAREKVFDVEFSLRNAAAVGFLALGAYTAYEYSR